MELMVMLKEREIEITKACCGERHRLVPSVGALSSVLSVSGARSKSRVGQLFTTGTQ